MLYIYIYIYMHIYIYMYICVYIAVLGRQPSRGLVVAVPIGAVLSFKLLLLYRIKLLNYSIIVLNYSIIVLLNY